MTVETVLGKFERYCTPKKNTSYERFAFMNRKQRNDECIEDYAVALRQLSMNCDYGHMRDSMIRDAIIMGVNSKKT